MSIYVKSDPFRLYVHIVVYTMSQKKVGHSYFYDNFWKSGPTFRIFSLINIEGSAEKDGIKTTTSPQICCCTTLQ